ncbi:hypothetical protein BDR26DRAFT_983500 [Obelidium mucronatum]|nr:hypothetical protein BDR26DRAFT_983500 [Obelidium mucronatum]
MESHLQPAIWQDNGAIILAYILTAISGLELLVLVYFISTLTNEWKERLSPFNQLLALGFVSMIGLCLSTAASVLENHNRLEPLVSHSLTLFFTGLVECSYLWIGWVRAKNILLRTSPISFKIFRVIVPVFPLLAITPVIAILLEHYYALKRIQAIFTAATALVLVSIESLLLRSFILYLRDTQVDHEELNRDFVIIAQNGIVSTTFLYSAFVLFSASVAVGYTSPHTNIILVACYYCINFSQVTLFIMKYRLHKYRIDEPTITIGQVPSEENASIASKTSGIEKPAPLTTLLINTGNDRRKSILRSQSFLSHSVERRQSLLHSQSITAAPNTDVKIMSFNKLRYVENNFPRIMVDLQDQCVIRLSQVMSAVTTLELIGFIYYISSLRQGLSWAETLSSFNILVSAGTIATIGLFLSLFTGLEENHNRLKPLIPHLFTLLFIGLAECSNLWIGWIRGKTIILRTSPITYRVLRVLVPFFPVIALLPILAALIETFWIPTKIEGIFTALAAATMIAMEISLLRAFILFLKNIRVDDTEEVDPDFIIVSQNGIIATCCWTGLDVSWTITQCFIVIPRSSSSPRFQFTPSHGGDRGSILRPEASLLMGMAAVAWDVWQLGLAASLLAPPPSTSRILALFHA